MSHRELLEQRINEAIDAGKYRAKGSPRAKSSPREDEPTPKPHAETEKRPEPAAKPEKLDHASFTEGLAAKRRDVIAGAIHKGLDDKFKGKSK